MNNAPGVNSKNTSSSFFLSLGSNLGNRFLNLQKATNLIFEEIGAINRISSVYETPAWGFEGEAFLNAVLEVETTLPAQEVLEKVLAIETALGRTRAVNNAYRSRTVDIDILLMEDGIVQTTTLKIPHPHLHQRKFVLAPLAELAPQQLHPQIQKNIAQLLQDCEDTSPYLIIKEKIMHPQENYDFSKFNYLAIEGNIGAGKTSLSTQIAKDFNGKLILERFRDNPFLPKFYKDPARYAFSLEMSFLADRYQQLVEDITQFDLFKHSVVADYDPNKSLIFARITLQEDEFNLYKKLFHMMHKELPMPDRYIYLYQNTEKLLQNIKKRGRKYEQSIQADYLDNLHAAYMDYIKSLPKNKVKIIDVSDLDFVENRKAYFSVLKAILN